MEKTLDIKHALPNLKDKPYGGASNINDPAALAFVHNNFVVDAKPNIKEFLQDYSEWAFGKHNVYGIENYKHLGYANGTTEIFDKFYLRHNHRRLRLFRGEYFYHMIMGRNCKDFAWIDEQPLDKNDFMVISMPFSDTGGIPNGFQTTLEKCEELEIPVCIDMAYLNLSKLANFNVDFKCIETIATSLSKIFPVAHLRIGLRLNRHNIDDGINAYTNNMIPYVNTASIDIGHKLIKNYSSTWIWDSYHLKQHDICNKLGVAPSNCVIFGIDHLNKYGEYNRGGKTNRLCFSKIL